MNILVTGAAGYIGSHTSKLLKKAGHIPVAFDNLSNGWAQRVKFGPFAYGDIRDEEALFRALSAFKIEAVIHFAAKAYVEESTRLPELYFDNNVNGTISLLKAMKRAGTKTLVFSSSCATYGNAQTPTIRENHPSAANQPLWPVKADVRTGHIGFCLCAGASIRDAALLQCHWERSRRGDFRKTQPETHVLPNLIKSALSGDTFSLFGTNHATPNGTAVRNYVHVMDLAQAHIRAIAELPGGGGWCPTWEQGREYRCVSCWR